MSEYETIKKPKLCFSKWYKWDNRNDYPLCIYPGVYLISITKKNIKDTFPKFKDVVYIGMTNSQKGLKGRWQQFFNSIQGKREHSGGNSIFEDKGHYDSWKENLYVSAMGIKCDVKNPTSKSYIKKGWVVFLEYEAFAKYFDEVGGHPKYNIH